MFSKPPEWRVLLIAGSSGIGKTTVARQLGLRFGTSWLHVDDLRPAFQHSRVTLPEATADLYFFEETPDVWSLSETQLRDGLIAVGHVLEPALEVVIENHVDTMAPVVIEGDGILPSLFARPPVHDRVITGQVRAVFLVEPEEEIMLANILARRRGLRERTEGELRTEARAKWLYGQWLATEAHRFGLSVLEVRPWSTLIERILATVNTGKL
jgi:2-phosphoglycerate kinase